MSQKLTQRDWAFIGIALLLAVVIAAPYWYPLFVPKVVPPPKYTTGLTVKFRIYDATAKAVITENVQVEFYTLGTNPYQRTFTISPIMTATYDSTAKVWTTSLDAGSYVIFIKDIAPSKTKYPVKTTVTVTGTDSETREVWLNPNQINMYQRASSTVKYEVDAWTGSAWVGNATTAGKINITTYDKWRITYTFDISDTDEIIASGRYYWTKITGLIPTSAYLDGSEVTVYEDTDITDDGLTGYYITFPQYGADQRHTIMIYFEDAGASTGTLKLTQYELYECHRTALRWWTDAFQNISVISA